MFTFVNIRVFEDVMERYLKIFHNWKHSGSCCSHKSYNKIFNKKRSCLHYAHNLLILEHILMLVSHFFKEYHSAYFKHF